ncbi:MAG: hypothetical protein ACFFAQ_02580 [Promethearchaeota archaeon]
MAIVMIWDPLERLLWGIGIAFALMCGVYFIYKGRKREIFNERIIMFGLASLPFSFAFGLLFTFLQVFQVQGTFVNNIFYGDYDNYISLYEHLGRASYISIGIGGIFFILAFDIVVKRTKYLLTIAFIILTGIEISSPTISMAKIVFNLPILLGLLILVPLVLYLYTRWSHLEFKAVSSFLLFGFLLFIMSLNLAKSVHKELNAYPLILGPLFLILGCCITILPTIINPKVVSRALIYWVGYAIITFPLFIVIIYVDIVKGLNPIFVVEFFIAFVYIYTLFFLVIRDIRSEIIISVKHEEDKEIQSDILGIFTRPLEVTEEDVIFHREQKICLVCKGKTLRTIYLCPECDALYCNKCSTALSNLENACWACNTPFDPLKPVKPYKGVEEALMKKGSKKSPKKHKIRDIPPMT